VGLPYGRVFVENPPDPQSQRTWGCDPVEIRKANLFPGFPARRTRIAPIDHTRFFSVLDRINGQHRFWVRFAKVSFWLYQFNLQPQIFFGFE
jgi:hypothetical protein